MKAKTYAEYLALAYIAAPEYSGDERALEEMLTKACKAERRSIRDLLALVTTGRIK